MSSHPAPKRVKLSEGETATPSIKATGATTATNNLKRSHPSASYSASSSFAPPRSSAEGLLLHAFMDRIVSVVTNDGRHFVGKLRGIDKITNLVLTQAHERVYALDVGVTRNDCGLLMIRGDNLALVGLLNKEADEEVEDDARRADPLKPIIH